MKRTGIALATVVLLSTLGTDHSAQAQGALAPAGAPAPTFKTLEQVEPRTPVTNLPYTVSAPGSYYLTTNLVANAALAGDGITIAASGVTLDLMGFELVGVAGAQNGIGLSGSRTNLCIRDGAVRDWGGSGVSAAAAVNSQLIGVRASHNLSGLRLGKGGLIRQCSAVGNNFDGLFAGDGSVIEGSVALATNNHGFAVGHGSSVTGCAARSNNVDGIVLGQYCAARDCTATGNGSDGIVTGEASVLQGCTVAENGNHGAVVGTGSSVLGCTARSNTVFGILLGRHSTARDVTASFNGSDGMAGDLGCTLVNCTAAGNGDDGLATSHGSTLQGCVAYANSDDGIVTSSGATVEGCTARANTGDGIRVISDCRVVGNTCDSNGSGAGDGAGVHATGADNRLDSNNVTGNDRGIDVDLAGNLIIRNSASGNGTNYVIAADNRYGPIINITAGGTAAVSGNSAVSTLTSTDPWANFSY